MAQPSAPSARSRCPPPSPARRSGGRRKRRRGPAVGPPRRPSRRSPSLARESPSDQKLRRSLPADRLEDKLARYPRPEQGDRGGSRGEDRPGELLPVLSSRSSARLRRSLSARAPAAAASCRPVLSHWPASVTLFAVQVKHAFQLKGSEFGMLGEDQGAYPRDVGGGESCCQRNAPCPPPRARRPRRCPPRARRTRPEGSGCRKRQQGSTALMASRPR